MPTAPIEPRLAPLRHPRDHVLFLYDEEAELMRALESQVSAGLRGQGVVVVVASAEHRLAMLAGLPPRRYGRARAEGRLHLLDAAETLVRLAPHGHGDPAQFEMLVGRLIRSAGRTGAPVTVYDEMSHLLSRDLGLSDGAAAETLWAGLRSEVAFDLVCPYALTVVRSQPDDRVAVLCHAHSSVHLGRAPEADAASEMSRLALVDALRSLLRVDSAEQAVGALLRAVRDVGGTAAPADRAPRDALPADLSLGEADPMVAVAPVDSPARAALERLLPALVEDAKIAARRAALVSQLSEQVDTDPLTGLGNRRGMGRVRALVVADSVAMLDLDHFKAVNDTYGHDAGDRVLVAFSRTLRMQLRSTDLVFRLGGEEFLVIMTGTTPAGVVSALEQLRERWVANRPLPITFSAGVAALAGQPSGNLPEALQAADEALYRAKNSGRDRFELATREADDAAHVVTQP